jgi:pimeloyl-ACP methyl ester carboxylesterase
MTPAGSRPTLVMLPGTFCDARVFARHRRALRGDARVMSFRVGDERGPSWTASMLKMLPPRFWLAGFSLGGICALELLRDAPERIQGLALVSSNAEAAPRVVQRRNRGLWLGWRAAGPQSVVKTLKPRYFHHPRQRQRSQSLVHDMAVSTPSKTARQQLHLAAARPSGLSVLEGNRQPLLLVSGANDGLCPPWMQRKILEVRPDAQWIQVPRCGHFLPLEAPGVLTRALRAWLSCRNTTNAGDKP